MKSLEINQIYHGFQLKKAKNWKIFLPQDICLPI